MYLYESGTDPETDAVFVLEAPEMVESADEISFGIGLSMQERDGMLLVTVTADAEIMDYDDAGKLLSVTETESGCEPRERSVLRKESCCPLSPPPAPSPTAAMS